MRGDRLAGWVAVGGGVTMVAACAWALAIPVRAAWAWMIPVIVVGLLWGWVEARATAPGAHPSQLGYLRLFIGWIALSVGAHIAVQALEASQTLGPGWAAGGRTAGGLLIALGLIGFGNLLPTLGPPTPLDRGPFVWQRVRRIVGWVLVVAGVGVGASWVVLPLDQASNVTNRVLALCSLLVFVPKLLSAARPPHTDRGRS